MLEETAEPAPHAEEAKEPDPLPVFRGADEDRPRVFSELDGKGQVLRVLTVLFLVLHLGCMLIGGAIPEIQKVFKPYVGFYADGLRMTNSWGMFGKPPTATNVTIEAVKQDGSTVLLSTTDAHQRSFFDRIKDSRMRKFEGRLAEDGDRRRLGEFFLQYFCNVATLKLGADAREVRVTNVIHELRDDDDKVIRQASTQIVLTRRCGPGVQPHPILPFIPPAVRGQPPPQQGGDL